VRVTVSSLLSAVTSAGIPELGPRPDLFCATSLAVLGEVLQSLVQAAFGGCCQWVLDTACQAVEWLSQPLGFESLTLRGRSINKFVLTSLCAGLSLKLTGGVQYQSPAPADYRGFRICGVGADTLVRERPDFFKWPCHPPTQAWADPSRSPPFPGSR
jgi:hypothetical protein